MTDTFQQQGQHNMLPDVKLNLVSSVLYVGVTHDTLLTTLSFTSGNMFC